MLCISYNSTKHQSFVYTHLITKQFNFKQFNLASVICLNSVYILNSSIWPFDRNLSGPTTPSGPWRDSNEGILHIFQALPGWILTIRLFSVISRTLIGNVLPLRKEEIGVFLSSSRLGLSLLGKLHLVVRIKFWSSVEWRIHFCRRYYQVHSDLEW